VLSTTSPAVAIYPLDLSISASSSWTWSVFASAQSSNANNAGALATVEFAQNTDTVLYTLPQCPGASGPMGGAVGFVFGLLGSVTQTWITESVYLAQDYSDPGNLIGVYLRYST
jgi:hypothetical protein